MVNEPGLEEHPSFRYINVHVLQLRFIMAVIGFMDDL